MIATLLGLVCSSWLVAAPAPQGGPVLPPQGGSRPSPGTVPPPAAGASAAVPKATATSLGVTLDGGHWPVGVVPTPAFDAPAATAPGIAADAPSIGAAPSAETAVPRAPAAGATGEQVGSPLPAVLRLCGSPAAFAALGGVTVRWRLTVHGPQGEAIGTRELLHFADAAAGDRDRLEVAAEGRVTGRLGPLVFAQRNQMPWPTMIEAATHELALFGLHLRLPWAFADQHQFALAGAVAATRGGEPMTRLSFVRRPEHARFGPLPEREPIDRFELWVTPDGLPRELVHELAASRQERRVLLEDWQPLAERGISLPHRRVYVDAAGRPTTTLQILEVRVGELADERAFRVR